MDDVADPVFKPTGPVANRHDYWEGGSGNMTKNGRKYLIIAGAALFLILSYYLIFIHDDVAGDGGSPVTVSAVDDALPEKEYFSVIPLQLYDRPSADANLATETLPRGHKFSGRLFIGDDGVSEWIALSGSAGYVPANLVSEIERPALVKLVENKIWVSDGGTDIWVMPDTNSSLLDRASVGTELPVTGLTGNDYLEIIMPAGGVGYIGDGARRLKLLNAEPIAIIFDPNNCHFGPELDRLFAELGGKIRAEYEALENREYASEEARDRAFAAVEGKSKFMKLERSFNGMMVTGMAQHYESQSLYFAAPRAQVVNIFRKMGFKIDGQGQFATQDLYAGIAPTARQSKAYGDSDLSCGV